MINPILLVAIPLLAAFLSIMMKKLSGVFLFGVSIFTLIGSFFVENGSYIIGGWKPPFGINLVIDDYSFLVLAIVNILFLLTILNGMWDIKKNATVLLVTLAGVNGIVMTGDFFNLFVFMEIIAISAYILASSTKKYYSVFKYLVLGTLGSSLYLFGIIILYGTVGTLNMADLATKLPEISSSVKMLAFTLIFSGLAVAAKILPFNSWVKGIFGNSNTLTGPMFSTVYATVSAAVVGRVFGQILTIDSNLIYAFITLTLITFIFAESSAMASKNLRSILTFSSIGQAGLIITMFLLGGFYAALIQLVNNAFAKMVMFSIATKTYSSNEDDKVENLAGIFRKHYMMGLGFTISALSLIGLPLFFGFYAKINILQTAFATNMWIPAFILIGSIIEGIYYIRLLVKLWNPGKEGEESSEDGQTSHNILNGFTVSIIALVVGAIFVIAGIAPDFLVDNIQKAANSLGDLNSYLSSVMGGI